MGELPKELEAFRSVGDKEADDYVRAIWPNDDPQAQVQLFRALGRWEPPQPVHDLPPALAAYVGQPWPWPAWADPPRLQRAQDAYQLRRLRARLVLGHYSLPVAYLHVETARTLTATGQLVLHPRRRLLETVRFVEAVMKPGSFSAGGLGMQWVRKVRLTHALVRKKFPSQAACDRMPLDQVELSFVLQTFGWVLADGLGRFGKELPAPALQDHLHAWSMIGHAMGLHSELLPGSSANAPTARWLFETIRAALMAGGDPLSPPGGGDAPEFSARLLTAALMTVLTEMLRERVPPPYRRWVQAWPWLDRALQPLPRSVMRRLCQADIANHLRVSRAPFFHWLVGWIALRLIDLDAVADYPIYKPSVGPRALPFTLTAYPILLVD